VGRVLAAALQLIVLHRVDGGEVEVNPAHVTSLHATSEAAGKQNKLFVGHVHCVIWLTDGRQLSVLESCAEVRRKLEGSIP
jgi:uncharacterized protein YlzI (FlbEa/FlbD family)